MNILILGDGDPELFWAQWFRESPAHRVVGAYPGFADRAPDLAGVAPSPDLDAALAISGVDLAIVGGPSEFRMEALKRVAALGWPAICLHPPGPDSEAYYQVSLSREETGAVIVPDLPLRLLAGIARIRQVLNGGVLGRLQKLEFQIPLTGAEQDLAHEIFPKLVDVVRALAGEVEAVWAIGQSRGLDRAAGLTVYLDMVGGVQSVISMQVPYSDMRRMFVYCERGTMFFDYSPNSLWPAKLSIVSTGKSEDIVFDDWDPHGEIFNVLLGSLAHRGSRSQALPSPNLDDGIRAMELTEAVVRSLKRERKISLHYQSIGEDANFKSFMTSTGCLILLGILFLLPVSLAGSALGLPWLIYISYLIPVMLGGFVLLQILRLAVRKPPKAQDDRLISGMEPAENADVEGD